MGLEAATFLSQLVATNPTSGDKKNQGDDHLRLLKSTLQGTFPNASRPFYFPRNVIQTANITLVEADDGKTFFCNTTGGPFTITLPTPTYDMWEIRVMNVTASSGPAFVAPPSGLINGNLAKIRAGIDYHEIRLVWANGVFYKIKPSGESLAGSIEWYPMSSIAGYSMANGGSVLRVDYPELFAAYGTSYGAADGTHFNIPNMLDRFPVAAGSSYSGGSIGGANFVALVAGELAPHVHNGTTDFGGVDHTHPQSSPSSTTGQFVGPIGANNGWAGNPANAGATGSASAFLHQHPFTTNSAGSGSGHENRPPYFGLYPMIRLC